MKIGKISSNAYKRSVLRQLNIDKKNTGNIKNGAGIGENCAIFASKEGNFIAEAVKQGMIFVDEKEANEKNIKEYITDIGALFTSGVNEIYAKGGSPRTVQASIICSSNIDEEQIKDTYKTLGQLAKQEAVTIVGAFTRVSNYVAGILVSLSFTGEVKEEKLKVLEGVLANQDIVITKWIGLEGTAYLAKKYKEDILKRYPEYLVDDAIDFRELISIKKEAALALKSGVCSIYCASEGGIFANLWELCEEAGVGLTIDLKKIPIRQETVEVCEFLGINPYELMSGGATIMTSWDGEKLAESLNREGIAAKVIGKITDSNDRIIMNDDEVRFMDRPKQDEIYKL